MAEQSIPRIELTDEETDIVTVKYGTDGEPTLLMWGRHARGLHAALTVAIKEADRG